MDEMANSEHADPLLRRVEILEKDNASLQTVVEMRTQELTHLRTKINEQVFQREDQMALQKRIDMAENRNQDLVCLLRNWQLTEK
jgi:predicted RNase H-like nuclease (RuvC/YqgF family)